MNSEKQTPTNNEELFDIRKPLKSEKKDQRN